jgi:hypothetical protein
MPTASPGECRDPKWRPTLGRSPSKVAATRISLERPLAEWRFALQCDVDFPRAQASLMALWAPANVNSRSLKSLAVWREAVRIRRVRSLSSRNGCSASANELSLEVTSRRGDILVVPPVRHMYGVL